MPDATTLNILRTHNNVEAARMIGVSESTARRWRAKHDIPNPFIEAHESAAHPDAMVGVSRIWPVEQVQDDFDNDIWLTLERLQAHMQELNIEQAEVHMDLPDREPIMVIFLSDLHLGHTECDMQRLRRDLDRLKQTEGVYVILGGDLMDNVVTSVTGRGMSHQQLTTVNIQKHLVERMCEYIGKDKTLAMLLGNHEAWSMNSDDFDPIAYFAKRIGSPYLGAQGFVNLSLGKATYRILAAHQFRMRSGFNLTHQAKRLEDFSGDADIVFTGHTHESSAESTQRRGADKFYGQAGSYLQSSRYGKQLGFTGTKAEMPGAVLWPNTKKVFGVRDAFNDGIPFLNAIRKEYGT